MADDLTDEQKEAENERVEKLQAKQEKTRRRRTKAQILEDMRPKSMRGIKGEDEVICVTTRPVGLDNNVTSGVDEEIFLPKVVAKKLQDVGAIKVKL